MQRGIPMHTTNSKAMKDADERAINVLGIPSTLLMTNAAKAVSDTAFDLAKGGKNAVVFCGSGNNGGDGIAAASYLLRRGMNVHCFLVGKREKMTRDAAEMQSRLEELGGRLIDFSPGDGEQQALSVRADVIVDAIFGIGLKRELSDGALAAVRLINSSGVPVVSADIPSGVAADTGQILGDAVHATATVTFTMAKPGHFVEPGCACCGKLLVADIGIPKEIRDEAATRIFAVDQEDVFLPQRPRVSHKGSFGKLLILGGSVGYTGAPAMCAMAAARAGAGLIYLGVPKSIYELTAVRLMEPMTFPLSESDGGLDISALPDILSRLTAADVCAVGCGLGRSKETVELMRSLIRSCPKRMVIDADGLFALGQDEELIKSAQKPPVLTPHEREFFRLGGTLSGDRISDAKSFAQSRNCILVLKGHRTICAFPDGEVYIINCGNPGMAKGGSGDVLTGIIGALLGQMPAKEAVVTACVIHARSGDICAQRLGEYSMLPTDIIEAIPETMKAMTR